MGRCTKGYDLCYENYISEIAIQSGSHIHITLSYEEQTFLSEKYEISPSKIQIGNLGNLHRRVYHCFWNLSIEFQKVTEVRVSSQILSINDDLKVIVQILSPLLQILIL